MGIAASANARHAILVLALAFLATGAVAGDRQFARAQEAEPAAAPAGRSGRARCRGASRRKAD